MIVRRGAAAALIGPRPVGPIEPVVSFDHLYRLTDDVGLFEHAEFTDPRTEHGYCVDDVARGLLVAAREPHRSDRLRSLAELCLTFLVDAQTTDGQFHNRRAYRGGWTDVPATEDWWGRALWGLGAAAARMTDVPALADRALAAFDRSADLRSEWSRAMAFAALGAAEVLRIRPDHASAQALLRDAIAVIGRPEPDPSWRWPELRLRYGNGVLAEALIQAGELLGDRQVLDDGLAMLRWLVDVESTPGHLSVTPVAGWSLGDPRPGFDQQPIEVAALADACAAAFDATGEVRWSTTVQLAAAWFHGANDAGLPMIDLDSGGSCDGLSAEYRNENQGAESTLAVISTMQQLRRLTRLIAPGTV